MTKRLKTPFKTIVTVFAAFALFACPSASGVKAANSFEAHYTTASVSMQEQLISSPGHRRNILTTSYTRFGVGIALDANGYVYLTQIFCR